MTKARMMLMTMMIRHRQQQRRQLDDLSYIISYAVAAAASSSASTRTSRTVLLQGQVPVSSRWNSTMRYDNFGSNINRSNININSRSRSSSSSSAIAPIAVRLDDSGSSSTIPTISTTTTSPAVASVVSADFNDNHNSRSNSSNFVHALLGRVMTMTATTTAVAAVAIAIATITTTTTTATNTNVNHRTLLESQQQNKIDENENINGNIVEEKVLATTTATADTTTAAAAAAAAAAEATTTTTTILNWSGTHSVHVPTEQYYEPETIDELLQIVQQCQYQKQSIRPIGSALSPNGIGFNPTGMISMIHFDNILHIDSERQLITVQAGARVSHVIDQLRSYHLTLPNLASIAEQQMGGFISVGAHGTGKMIAPIDQYVHSMKVITPAQGLITVSETENADLFHMMKVGLGCLGIITEMTIKCIPSHHLREHTFCLSRQQAKEKCTALLEQHKHMRYMWIPYTDTVVCVTNDPVTIDTPNDEKDGVAGTESSKSQSSSSKANVWNTWTKSSNNDDKVQNSPTSKQPQQSFTNPLSPEERLKPMIDLLIEVSKDTAQPYTMETIRANNMIQSGFGTIRDVLLSIDPLNVQHVQKCNQAEAEFWRNNEDYIVKPSDELLQFDCGGQQWVWEVCFPTGTQEVNNGNDIRFMEELLDGIEKNNIPAHAPIEQRWSASSSSYMSPAYYDGTTNGLYCWVGIINYLPSGNILATPEQEAIQRQDITNMFTGPYCNLLRQIGKEYDATSHWAKLEVPKSIWDIIDLQLHLSTRYPIDKFNAYRSKLDPNNILASTFVNTLFGKP